MGFDLTVEMTRTGWEVSAIGTKQIVIWTYAAFNSAKPFVIPTVQHLNPHGMGYDVITTWNIGGAAYWHGGLPRLEVRHWLIVTTFALFNALLMFVYRRRSDELEFIA